MSSVREATLTSLEGKQLTRVLGRLTIGSIRKTQKEMAAEYVKVKTTHKHFSLGAHFVFTAAILNTKIYSAVHNKIRQTQPYYWTQYGNLIH